jgi:hypothetical protein
MALLAVAPGAEPAVSTMSWRGEASRSGMASSRPSGLNMLGR